MLPGLTREEIVALMQERYAVQEVIYLGGKSVRGPIIFGHIAAISNYRQTNQLSF